MTIKMQTTQIQTQTQTQTQIQTLKNIHTIEMSYSNMKHVGIFELTRKMHLRRTKTQ